MPVAIGFAGALERARQWLTAALEQGPQLRSSVVKRAVAEGYNEPNIEAAARQLGVISEKTKISGQGWRSMWRLPEETERVRGQPVVPGDEHIPAIAEQLQKIQALQRTVDIYRYEDGEPGFLDSVPGNEVSLRSIKRRWGGGRYQVEGVSFVISGPQLGEDGAPTAMRPRGSTVAPSSANGAIDTNTLLMQMLKQQGDIMTALLTSLVKGGSSSAVDPVALFKAMDDAVGKRLSVAPATPVQQALELLEKGIAMGRDSAETEEPGSRGLQQAIGAVAPFLNALASRMGQQQPPPAAPALPAGAPAAPDVREDGLPVTPLQRVLVDLGPAMPELLEQAKRGTDPRQVAEYVHQNASDQQYDALAEAASSPQFVDDLMAELAKRAPNAGWAMTWLRAAVQSLYELLVADRADDEQPAAGGNGDGAGGGATGPAGGAPAHR